MQPRLMPRLPHLPGSAAQPGAPQCSREYVEIMTVAARDGDTIVVQEKLDGACCAVERDGDTLLAQTRGGYPARTSRHRQHQLFADWVRRNEDRFLTALFPGERCVGEWLAQAHGRTYALMHEPYVIFDIVRNSGSDVLRMTRADVQSRIQAVGFIMPQLIHSGRAISVATASALIDPHVHGALAGGPEGLVYRVERDGKADYIARYVFGGVQHGRFLDRNIWNWQPPS